MFRGVQEVDHARTWPGRRRGFCIGDGL